MKQQSTVNENIMRNYPFISMDKHQNFSLALIYTSSTLLLTSVLSMMTFCAWGIIKGHHTFSSILAIASREFIIGLIVAPIAATILGGIVYFVKGYNDYLEEIDSIQRAGLSGVFFK